MVALSGSWGRLAPSLVTMVQEADRTAPQRSTRSDGSLGDQAHASRSSFHNPSGGYVDALDLTHDPGSGFDAHARARQVAARCDPRIDHIISNRQIWSALRPSWRRYAGANPHTQHAHFAVKRSSTGRAPTRAWWAGQSAPDPQPVPPKPPEEENDDMLIVSCPGQPTRFKDGPTCSTIGPATRLQLIAAKVREAQFTKEDYDEMLSQVNEALGR